MHVITAIILIGTNFLICITANTSNLPKLTPGTGFFTKHKSASDDDSNMLPLPWETFTKDVSDLLSPDMFSQTDPISYLLAKVKKLPRDVRGRINMKLQFILHCRNIPRPYIPYAEISSSLISSLNHLEEMKKIIPLLQPESQPTTTQSNYLPKPLDMSIIEPELSPLFSSHIFTDKNSPSRLLGKLLSIPEKDISKVKSQLENFMKSRKFPRRYSRFAKCLKEFFEADILQCLKKNMAKIQTKLSTKPSAQVANYIWEDDESNPDVSDASQPIDVSNRFNKITRWFENDVIDFLSPDMFTQTNPLAYFMDKATKLEKYVIKNTCSYLSNHLDKEEFPQPYIPYAELASSLLTCLVGLESIDEDIFRIRNDIVRRGVEIKNNVSTLDPDLSILFSPEIILDAPKPSIKVLEILITVAEDEISELVTRLKELGDDYRFPYQYKNYNAYIWKFLDSKGQSLLRLQDDVAEVEHVLISNSSNSADNKVPIAGLSTI